MKRSNIFNIKVNIDDEGYCEDGQNGDPCWFCQDEDHPFCIAGWNKEGTQLPGTHCPGKGTHYLIPAPVAEQRDKLDEAKDGVVEQLNNIKLLWDGGYIKATDDGLLRAETVQKAWDALAKLEAITNEAD